MKTIYKLILITLLILHSNYIVANNAEDWLNKLNEEIKRNPQDISLLQKKVMVLDELGIWKELLKTANNLLILAPNSSQTYYYKGKALAGLGNYKKAIEAYDSSIKLNPKNIDAHFLKASILYQLENYQEAVNEHNKIIEINPHIAGAYFFKAVVLNKLNLYPQALTTIKKALEIEPTNSMYIEARDDLQKRVKEKASK
ncbi:Tetratricopeptide repeat containing protein (plasmid) [Candidatus Trichorickettsia mobilis]|uniref:tetratricopeptide repeat protein n=1 Tax=Candidatus Trichorickettsia mobilis TaxID=1346319 RepID=UPI002B25D04C|nr:tetratricopeptide repeat protein [Candidatus Trichorickettsia mobilis]WPY01935.1 Tetratricopeptide repeat containing protein [Candidatus Trichorickettsia mobilis]